MDQLTAYLLNLLEVVEKELQLFRLIAGKTFMGISLFAAGALLLGVGLLLLGWTLFTALCILAGPVWAGLASAAFILAGGGVLLWSGAKALK